MNISHATALEMTNDIRPSVRLTMALRYWALTPTLTVRLDYVQRLVEHAETSPGLGDWR